MKNLTCDVQCRANAISRLKAGGTDRFWFRNGKISFNAGRSAEIKRARAKKKKARIEIQAAFKIQYPMKNLTCDVQCRANGISRLNRCATGRFWFRSGKISFNAGRSA